MNKLILVSLGGILLLAAFLRLYRLTDYPGGFNADEAAIGYNAYSLIHTGRDEHGKAWPLTFKSFGDYKAPLYFYIDLPFVATMGLTEYAVRLPSALFGIGTVLLVFFLARKLLNNDLAALFSALLLAISPWHIHFSRGGWEVNVATFFIVLGMYAFIKGLENSRFFYLAFISFLASLYTYQSPKIVVPLLCLVLFILYAKQLWSLRKKLIVPIAVGIVCGSPLLLSVSSQSGTARFTGVSIFADTGPFWAVNEARGEHGNPNSSLARVFHNKVLGYGLDFLKNYSDHFTPAFLFFTGDKIDRNNVTEMGQMYVIDALFLVCGLWMLFKSDLNHKKALFAWLLVAPTAAAITFQTPHALRSHNMVVPLVIVTGFGFSQLLQLTDSRRLLFITVFVSTLSLLGLNFAKYLHQYYVHVPKELPLANNYGFNELVPYVESVKDQYKNIVVTDRYDQPYILFLFYSRKDPLSFQQQVVLTPRDKFGFSTVRRYDTYEFRAVKPEDLVNLKQTLIAGSYEEIDAKDPRIIKTIYFKNGKPAFQIVKT